MQKREPYHYHRQFRPRPGDALHPGGQAVTSFSVASNRTWTDASGQRREQTEWFACQAWGRLAETCNQYLSKGQQVFIEGRVSRRTFEKRDGGTGASLDVNVTNVQFLGQRSGTNGDDAGKVGTAAGHYVPDEYGAPDDLDHLPF